MSEYIEPVSLSEITDFCGKNVISYPEFLEIGNSRLYYCAIHYDDDLTEKSGFYFYAVDHNGSIVGEEKWGPKTGVETICHGVAYFDGISHIWFGDKDGYIHHPNILKIAKISEKLRELETQFCRDNYHDHEQLD